jgi:hypothetical protein
MIELVGDLLLISKGDFLAFKQDPNASENRISRHFIRMYDITIQKCLFARSF